jgi:hypothetical protein
LPGCAADACGERLNPRHIPVIRRFRGPQPQLASNSFAAGGRIHHSAAPDFMPRDESIASAAQAGVGVLATAHGIALAENLLQE